MPHLPAVERKAAAGSRFRRSEAGVRLPATRRRLPQVPSVWPAATATY